MNKSNVAAASALAVLAGALALGLAACGAAANPVPVTRVALHRAARSGVWGKARTFTGAAARNTNGSADADILLSCPSAGNCAAGGDYEHDFSDARSFVVDERHGTWGQAQKVLLSGKGVTLIALSCPSAGNCSAGGDYEAGPSDNEAFVVGEKNGTWGKAARLRVPGTGAGLSPMSCTSAGNCIAGGEYLDAAYRAQAFVASERHGTWGAAQQLSGSGALNAGGYATLNVLSCPSAGHCAAGGYYTDGRGRPQAFVAAQRHGTWGTQELPGSGALNQGGHAVTVSVSCPSAGNCEASGFYTDRAGRQQGFVAAQRHGIWGAAQELPGLGALNTGGSCSQGACVDADVGVSCPSAGNCEAGGFYTDRAGHVQMFVDAQRGGTWGRAQKLRGLGALNQGRHAGVQALCPSAGNCEASGYYTDRAGHLQAFVDAQRGGTWGLPLELPGTGALNTGGDAEAQSLACPAVGKCATTGFYTDRAGHHQAFVASEAAVRVPTHDLAQTLNVGTHMNSIINTGFGILVVIMIVAGRSRSTGRSSPRKPDGREPPVPVRDVPGLRGLRDGQREAVHQPQLRRAPSPVRVGARPGSGRAARLVGA